MQNHMKSTRKNPILDILALKSLIRTFFNLVFTNVCHLMARKLHLPSVPSDLSDVEILQLERAITEEQDAENDQAIPEKKEKLNLQTKSSSSIPDEDDEVEFYHAASSVHVDTSISGKTSSRAGAWSQHNLVLIVSILSSKTRLC